MSPHADERTKVEGSTSGPPKESSELTGHIENIPETAYTHGIYTIHNSIPDKDMVDSHNVRIGESTEIEPNLVIKLPAPEV